VILEIVKVGGIVEFRVRDSGIGLAKESLSEIFDMFAQVHASGRDARGGLGIGLALARQIAHLHDGKITVDSLGLNKGSTFVFSMPLIDKPKISGVVSPPALIANQALRLLVVDDNLDGANTLADMLTELGHLVTTAYNGTSAIVLLENEPFDLAFLDLGLPDKTGIEVALTVLKKGSGKHVRLIALTGLSRERDRFVTQAAGFEEHLIKPAKFEDLVRLVGNLNVTS
jgi:CheY-like chemotaxis protein